MCSRISRKSIDKERREMLIECPIPITDPLPSRYLVLTSFDVDFE